MRQLYCPDQTFAPANLYEMDNLDQTLKRPAMAEKLSITNKGDPKSVSLH
jgi:hypothetical protein